MSKVVRIPIKSPPNILADFLDKIESFDDIIVMGYAKDGEDIMIGWSDQTHASLTYAAMRFSRAISDIVEE